MIERIEPTQFAAEGFEAINRNFETVMETAQAFRAADNDSGLAIPVPMAMGADDRHWALPEGLVGPFIVLDHGLTLRSDDYSVVGDEVVLNYAPAAPYRVFVAWSTTKAGITPPVPLTNRADLGVRYWELPEETGSSVLVFDGGRLLKRSEYAVEDRLVMLQYSPTLPATLSASWGAGGPGLIAPLPLRRLDPASADTTKFVLPRDAGRSVLILDHGVLLTGDDYVLDRTENLLTLKYVPAEPLDIAATWGYSMDGTFLEFSVLEPMPDGVNRVFRLAQTPVTDTVHLRARQADGSVVFYERNVDFTVTGRRVDFTVGVTPPAASTLMAAMMAVIFNDGPSVDKLDGFDAVSAFAPGLGTAAQAGKLVATDGSGKLPASIVPRDAESVDGFSAISSMDSRVGTPAAANYLAALGLDGRFDNDTLPYSPVLGGDDNAVVYRGGADLEIDTLSEFNTYNADGTLSRVELKNVNDVVVKQIDYAYAAGRLISRTDAAGGRTSVCTYNYDVNGVLTSTSRSLA